MITTVTLNASVDKMYRLDCPVEVGRVMRVAEVNNSAGGKGLNAARAVVACGEEACATGFVGGNNGRTLVELATADGVTCDFVETESETRCCINAMDANLVSTELLEPGRPVSAGELVRLEGTIYELADRSDAVAFCGSVPAGAPADVYRRLVDIVKRAGKPCILDTSGKLLVDSLAAAPTMVKPNADEIEAILGKRPEGMDEIIAAANEVRERYGIEQVVVSLGSEGAVMSHSSGTYRVTPAKIEAVNPVGSGDTMVGAFAVAMSRGMEPAEQLRFASACASANCLTKRTGFFEMSTAERLMEQTTVTRL